MTSSNQSSPLGIIVAQGEPAEVQAVAVALRQVAGSSFALVAEGDHRTQRVDCVLCITDDSCAAPTASELASVHPQAPLIALERGQTMHRTMHHPGYSGVLPLTGLTGGMLAGMIGIAVRLRDAEQRAATAEAQIESHARLASLGEITASIGHELGNLLAILVAWTSQMKIESARLAPGEPRLGEIAGKLEHVTGRMMRIVSGLGMCSRGIVDHVHLPYSLSALLDQALAITGPHLRVRDVRIERAVPSDIVLKCNPGQIAQALVTLIKDATQQAAETADRTISIETALGDGELELVVETSAATTVTTAEGFSVSQSLLQSIASRHKGEVLVDDSGGKRRKILRLPCLTSTPAANAATVLVVDDDADIADVLTAAFKQVGIKCERALSGAEALDKATKQGFDVVISDIKMPGLDGIEMMARLKANAPRPPRFVLTTGYREQFEGQIAALKDADIVDKPYDARALAERVRGWLPNISG